MKKEEENKMQNRITLAGKRDDAEKKSRKRIKKRQKGRWRVFGQNGSNAVLLDKTDSTGGLLLH